jgi:rare lipoprotein A
LLANCSGSSSFGSLSPRYGVSRQCACRAPGEPIPKGGGYNRVGAPYSIGGRTYTPEENPSYRAEGVASWYGPDFHGRQTANGEVFDMQSISAAHPTMPLPSYARVTNLSNHKSVIVRVNDRGPYGGNRLIDVSVRAANLLGFYGSGLAPVRVICRPRTARRLRRHHADGNAAAGRAGADAVAGAGRFGEAVHAGRSLAGSTA